MRNEPFLSLMLTSGGDGRIIVPSGSNTNRYGASPYPRATLGYASSTANDISKAAFNHLEKLVSSLPDGSLRNPTLYSKSLELQRERLRCALELPGETDIVFAPSGTDLEFIALALAKARGNAEITNILLGQNEVGSGCVLAAAGKYFAGETAVQSSVPAGTSVEGLENTELINIPIRTSDGRHLTSDTITSTIWSTAENCRIRGRHLLVHVVHGSKTGLVLPLLCDIDRLKAEFGEGISLVVDACQVRIDNSVIQSYLAMGAMVMLSGSKFMGGPPFSGFLLVPPCMVPKQDLAPGLGDLFRRSEWPVDWRQADYLPDGSNPGLLLRLEAAIFELERYSQVPAIRRMEIIQTFGKAVIKLSERIGANLVEPALSSDALHEATLATLDLSSCPGSPDFATAQRLCRVLAARGLRLGQPVKCSKLDNDEWSGTLRISISMPLIVELAALSPERLEKQFDMDMARIADVLESALRPVVA